jgi:acetyl esterase/lipase
MWNKPLPEIRKNMESMKSNGMPTGIINRKETVNGVESEVFFCEKAPKNKAVIYLHGGGFCMGIYNSNREFVAGISKQTGINIYMPDYRLAPEHPYPAALEDTLAVYNGLLEKGYEAHNIMMMGDSSGCALAVSTMFLLQQRGIALPKGLVFITPLFDLTGKGETYSSRAGKDPFKLKDPLVPAKFYLGTNSPSDPMISPLFGNLKGLPPVLIHSADYDVFLSDSIRFKEKMEASGGKVIYKKWEKMWHIFHMQSAIVPESRKALEEICNYIKNEI